MGRKNQKPFNPAAGIRPRRPELDPTENARPETWGVALAPLNLPANADVAARTDGRGRVQYAHRVDVFEALHARGGLNDAELAAARRLEQDMGQRAGLFRPEASLIYVDAQGTSEGVTQKIVEAGRRVDQALSLVGPRQALLLRALIEPAVTKGVLTAWRTVVEQETRETNPVVQSPLVRSALDNLALGYQALDALPKGRRRPPV
jgi:hypothetical protein